MGWIVRKGIGLPEFEYSPQSPAFTIKLFYGENYENIGFIDFCLPEEMSYLAIVKMAAQLGCNEVVKIFYKRLDSDFETDALELKRDRDAKELGNFALSDLYRQVAVYCQTRGGFVDSSSEDEIENDVIVESDELEKFSGSDEDMGKEDETLTDVPIFGSGKCNKPTNSTFAPSNDDEIEKNLNEGYVSDELNSKCGSDDEDDPNVIKYPRFTQADLVDVKFELGMLFATGLEFRDALREYAVKNFKDVYFKKNSAEKMILRCGDPQKKCKWFMYVTKLDGQETVQIRTLNNKHTCTRARKNRHLKPRYIAKKFIEIIRMNPDWPNKNFVAYISHALEYTIGEYVGYRAFRLGIKAIQGSSAEQYNSLYDYIGEIRRSNPGTTVKIKVKGGRFSRIYICWAALKRGFIEGCRPLIGLDGCHLTGPHKGVLLTAVAIDANDCMYPFGYAVVDAENYETWKWFIKLIKVDLNIMRDEDYTFISDKQKGLIKAMEEVMPLVEHRFCVRHLYNNFKQQHKGLVLKDLLWKAARASTINHFTAALQEMKVIDEAAYQWLFSKPPEQWTRSHFKVNPKTDILLNNLCESFNAAIKSARSKPILTMLEEIRIYLMDLVMRKKESLIRKDFIICPKIQAKLEKLKGFIHNYKVVWNGQDKFEVSSLQGSSRYATDIKERQCGCNRWQLSGLPCVHAVACISKMDEDVENFVHECYKKSSYMSTYTNFLNPLNGQDLWERTVSPSILPPLVTSKKRGKPQRVRRKDPDEQKEMEDKQRLSRGGVVIKCKLCGNAGHNSRTCGKPPRPKKKYEKKKKSNNEGEVMRPTKKPRQDYALNDDGLNDIHVEGVTKVGFESVDVQVGVTNVGDDVGVTNVGDEVGENNDGDEVGENNEGVNENEEDRFFWDNAVLVATELESQSSQLTKSMQVRKSERIKQTVRRRPITPITPSIVDLTMEDDVVPTQESNVTEASTQASTQKGKNLLHCGIMKPFKPPKKQPKGVMLKDCKLHVSASGMKAAMDMLKKKKN